MLLLWLLVLLLPCLHVKSTNAVSNLEPLAFTITEYKHVDTPPDCTSQSRIIMPYQPLSVQTALTAPAPMPNFLTFAALVLSFLTVDDDAVAIPAIVSTPISKTGNSLLMSVPSSSASQALTAPAPMPNLNLCLRPHSCASSCPDLYHRRDCA